MWEKITSDPVATYAAILSTLTAILGGGHAVFRWLQSGPQAWVAIINPHEVRSFNHQTCELVVSNTGATPIVVKRVVVTMHAAKKDNRPLNTARFDHTAGWDPSVELVPDPSGKPNSLTPRPRVIQPGHEVHQHLRLFSAFDPEQHWLCAKVSLRHKRAPIVAWAAPVPPSQPEPSSPQS